MVKRLIRRGSARSSSPVRLPGAVILLRKQSSVISPARLSSRRCVACVSDVSAKGLTLASAALLSFCSFASRLYLSFSSSLSCRHRDPSSFPSCDVERKESVGSGQTKVAKEVWRISSHLSDADLAGPLASLGPHELVANGVAVLVGERQVRRRTPRHASFSSLWLAFASERSAGLSPDENNGAKRTPDFSAQVFHFAKFRGNPVKVSI